jgi:hypothetical protein
MLVLRKATRYAVVDQDKRQIVLDLGTLFLAMLSVGLSDKAAGNYGAESTWFAEWLSMRVGDKIRLRSATDEGMTGTPTLLGALQQGFEIIPSGSVRNALEVAVSYANRTLKGSSSDLRHLFAAMVTSRSMPNAVARLGWAPTEGDLADLRQALYARIAANREQGEDMGAWRQILLAEEGQPPAPRREFLPRFSNDRPAAYDPSRSDHLGTDPDIVALARLICLKEATTPLSIGIFGGWGAGKSTFMNRLEAEITRITESVAAQASTPRNAGEKATADHQFISQVVHIRFNAWQFADANLWASLTAEFFDQLRAGGFSRQDSAVHAKLVTQVNDHVQQLTKAAAATEETLNQGDHLVVAAREARDKAMNALKAEQSTGPSRALLETISDAYEKHKADLIELGRRTDQKDVIKGINGFVETAKVARSISGKLELVWASLRAKPTRMAVFIFAVLLAAVSIWTLLSFDLASVVSVLTSAGVLGALTAAVGAVRPGIRAFVSILRTTADFAQKLDLVTAENLKIFLQRKAALEEKEAALKAAEAEAAARREAAAQASKALARYVSSSGGSNPPRLLRYMLEDDPDTKAIDREIGLISRARRLFQAVDTIVAEKKSSNGNAHEDVPDRIVLYIDDLDRCTHRQVYEALQAIHLLLDFELFAVVVAVDVAWIQAALAAQTEMGMPAGPAASGGTAEPAVDLERRKRAIAYLEKIFQLPFWLRPLNADDEKGGSYGAFIRGLIESDTAAREDKQAAHRGNEPSNQSTTPPDAADTQTRPDEFGGQTGTGTGSERKDGLGDALEAVTLSQDEVDFLSSPAIGTIAPRTPRGAKRLLNVYRLVRARMSDSASLPIPAADAEMIYPIVALLVAVETGQPVEVADPLYEGLKTSAPETDFIKDIIHPEVQPSDPGRVALQSAFRACPALKEAVIKVMEARGDDRPSLTVGDVLPLARLVRRYSFNRYQ